MAGLSLGLGLGLSPGKGGGVVYDPDAAAYFPRLTPAPDVLRKGLLNDLVVNLKDNNVWPVLDILGLPASYASQPGRQNLVQDIYNAAAMGSPAFLADRGYTGDAVGAYLDWNCNPATATGLKLSATSMAVSAWFNSDNATSSAVDAGQVGTFNTQTTVRNTSSQIICRPNAASNFWAGSIADSRGLTGWSRSDGANAVIYKNGVQVASGATASAAFNSSNLTALRCSTNYSSRQIAAYVVGSHRTAAQELALYNALNTYLTAIGAA